jgi:hypothetical protein
MEPAQGLEDIAEEAEPMDAAALRREILDAKQRALDEQHNPPLTAAAAAADSTGSSRPLSSALQSRSTAQLYVLDFMLPKVFQCFLASRAHALLHALTDTLGVRPPVDLAAGAPDALYSRYAQQQQQPAPGPAALGPLRRLLQYDIPAVDELLDDAAFTEQLSSVAAIARFNLAVSVDLLDAQLKPALHHYLSALSATDAMRGCAADAPAQLLMETRAVPSGFTRTADELDVGPPENLAVYTHPTEVASASTAPLQTSQSLQSPLAHEYIATLTALELLLSLFISVAAATLAPDVLPVSRKASVGSGQLAQDQLQQLEGVLCYHGWLLAALLPFRAGVFPDSAPACHALFRSHAALLTAPTTTAQYLSALPAPRAAATPHARMLALMVASTSPSLTGAPPRSPHIDRALLLFLQAFQHRYCGLAQMRVFRVSDADGPVLRAVSHVMGTHMDSKSAVELMVGLCTYSTAYWAVRADPEALTRLNASSALLRGDQRRAVVPREGEGLVEGDANTAHNSPAGRAVRSWLDLMCALTSSYATVTSLGPMRAVQWLLCSHVTHMLVRSALYADRQRWTEALGRIVFRPSTGAVVARELLLPYDLKFGTLAKQLQQPRMQPAARAMIVGLFHDVTGLLRACDTRAQYAELFPWLCPRYSALVVRACEGCWGNTDVVEAAMGLIDELANNRSGRAVFGT